MIVLGQVSPQSLGITLTHEHLSIDYGKFYTEAPQQLQDYLTEKRKITLANVGVLRQYPYSSRYNLDLRDNDACEAILKDVALFKKWGGGTIVENSSHGLSRDLEFCHEVAQKTGVNVVVGTGHYLAAVQSESALNLSLEALSDQYSKEIITGVDLRGDGKEIIRCGLIGEVGSGWPLNSTDI